MIICGKFQVPTLKNVFSMSKSLKMHIFAQKCSKMPQKALSRWMLKVQQAVSWSVEYVLSYKLCPKIISFGQSFSDFWGAGSLTISDRLLSLTAYEIVE